MIYLTESRTWLRVVGIILFLLEIRKRSKHISMAKKKSLAILRLPILDPIIFLLEGGMMVLQIFRGELMRLLFLIVPYQLLRLGLFMKLQKLHQSLILHHCLQLVVLKKFKYRKGIKLNWWQTNRSLRTQLQLTGPMMAQYG